MNFIYKSKKFSIIYS